MDPFTPGGPSAGVPTSPQGPAALPPNPPGGIPNPPGGSKGPLLQMILAFLAGVGAKPMTDMVRGIMGGTGGGRGAKGGNPNRPHQGGLKVTADPSNPGGVGETPSAMQQGQPNPAQLLQLLAMLKARQGGGGIPS